MAIQNGPGTFSVAGGMQVGDAAGTGPTNSDAGYPRPAGTSWSGATASPSGLRKWLVLATIAIAQLMIVLDATIMNIALPSAQNSLGFSLADRQWVVTAYALAFGSLLLPGGKLADLIGRKRTFLIGLAGFAAASAVGGAATSFAMLATARACQGALAALLAPSALSLLATTFTAPQDRRTAFGVYGAVAGAGGGVGLVLGGLLTQYLSWRWCLYVNLVFAGLALTGASLLLRSAATSPRSKLDLPGAVLVSGGMFCLVYGFSNAATHPWAAASTWGFLVAGAALLIGFAWWQARTTNPLLPPRIVLDRNRGGAYLGMLIVGAGMFGVMLFLNFYMQQGLRYSPIRAGLAFLPMVLCTMVLANLSNIVLMPRFGPRLLVGTGMLLAGTSAALLTRLGLHSGYWSGILPSVVLLGLGLGLIFAPVADTGTSGVPPADSGVASATLNAGNQLGGSMGTSFLNSIFASAFAGFLAANAGAGGPGPLLFARAALHGYGDTFWWCAGIFAFGGLVTGGLMRPGPLAKPAWAMGDAGAAEWSQPVPAA